MVNGPPLPLSAGSPNLVCSQSLTLYPESCEGMRVRGCEDARGVRMRGVWAWGCFPRIVPLPHVLHYHGENEGEDNDAVSSSGIGLVKGWE